MPPSPPGGSPSAQAKVGKYEMGAVLGGSTHSVVRLCTDSELRTRCIVAIDLRRARDRRKLLRELEPLESISHPHVIQLFKVIPTENHVYAILEHAVGQNLPLTGLDEDTGRRYFRQLISAVHHYHAHGIVFHHLEMPSLLLVSDNNLKIANVHQEISWNETFDKDADCFAGPRYLAPEVLAGNDVFDDRFAANVWSCGVILYAMIDGNLPFEGSVASYAQHIQRGEYIMSPRFSESLKDLISKILVVDPKARATVESIMQHPWFTAGNEAES